MLYLYRKYKNITNPQATSNRVAAALGAKICSYNLKPDFKDLTYILNWGHSVQPLWEVFDYKSWINPPFAIKNSANKNYMYKNFKKYNIPTYEFWSRLDLVVNSSLLETVNSFDLVGRELINSSSGKGIVQIEAGKLMENLETNPKIQLYTKYEEKKYEQRLFIVNNEIIEIAEKRKMGEKKRKENNIDKVNKKVKTNSNGWIFAKNDIQPITAEVEQIAKEAMWANGLLSGVVDIAFNNPSDVLVVETNSAPGITSTTTFDKFISAIKELTKD